MEVQPRLVHVALVGDVGRIGTELARGAHFGPGSSRRLMLLMQYRWSVGTS